MSGCDLGIVLTNIQAVVKIERPLGGRKMVKIPISGVLQLRRFARHYPVLFILVTTILVLVTVNIARREVILSVDGESRVVTTFSDTVAEVLDQAGIVMGDADLISHAPESKIKNRDVIEIHTAFPVAVTVDGGQAVPMVAEGTVNDVLLKLGISLGELDRVEPALSHKLVPGDTVDVVRVERYLVTERTDIAIREIRRGNPSLDRGESRVLEKGATGLREDTVEITLENGKEVTTKIVQSEMLRVKKDRVVEFGENTVLSRGGRVLDFKSVFQVVATAYCAGTEASGCPIDSRGYSQCTGRYNNAITASGRRAVAGSGTADNPHIVAVDRRIIPLGSRLYIDGYGYAIAADTGGAIIGNRIDLLLSDHTAARRFGRKRLRIYLLR